MQKILAAIDFSQASHRAASVALSLARRTRAELRIVHVVPPKGRLAALWRTDRATAALAHQGASAALKDLADSLDPSREVLLSTGTVSGRASIEIARAARDFHADLLVIGARGEHEVDPGQLTLGGTALKLLNATPIPLLLVRTAPEPTGSVLAAVDLSPVSTDVLAWARAMARDDEHVTLFHAYDVPFSPRLQVYGISKESIEAYGEEENRRREHELQSLIAAMGGDGDVRGTIEQGDAIDCLFRHFKTAKPKLIVLGKHEKRSSKQTLRTGSVSRHVAMFAPMNVLIVTPGSKP